MAREPRPVFVLRLKALPGTDAYRELRLVLKRLLRAHGFRCLTVREERDPAPVANASPKAPEQ